LLHRIAVAAQQLTDTEASSILLLDRKSGQLYFEAATNLPGIRSIVVPTEGSIAGLVVQTGKPIVVPDVREDPHFYPQADEQSDFNTRSILAVPMVVRGNVIGVLEVVNKLEEAEFTREDVEMLTVLGGQAAVAVQNALLFQQSDLVAEIVHEMRTPLMSVIGYSELMQQPPVRLYHRGRGGTPQRPGEQFPRFSQARVRARRAVPRSGRPEHGDPHGDRRPGAPGGCQAGGALV
jgi:GAF domain-containing protein